MAKTRPVVACALAGLVLLMHMPPVLAATEAVVEASWRPAMATPRATQAVLLSIAMAGTRAVAVGERGVVLLSDDAGAHWRQAQVPASTTLTAVRFVDAQQGWAVGHAGVVLHTADGGAHWTRQLDGRRLAALAAEAAPEGTPLFKTAQRLVVDGPDKPLLDLHFFDTRRGLVVGAYGLVYGTEDAGQTWTAWLDRLDNPRGLHLNALAVQGERIVIAGEQGLLLQSTDGGLHFSRLKSPYEGSWFAAVLLPSGRLLLGGLRGNLWWSDDGGVNFSQTQMSAPVTVSALTVLPDGSVLALDQAGTMLSSRDRGKTWTPLSVPPGAPLTAVTDTGSGLLLATSLRGARELPALKTRAP